MTGLVHSYEWDSPEFDPNDEHMGDVIEATTLDDVGRYDAAIVGEPYDGGQVGTRGAAKGPEGVRHALQDTKTCNLTAGPVAAVADLGDVDYAWGRDVEAVHEEVEAVAAEVHRADTFPVFVGGGHDLGYPNVAPLLEIYDSVGVINFDAHADVREVTDKPHNGTPYRRAFNAGLNAYSLVGGRHFETSTPYVEYMAERNTAVVTAEEVGADPTAVVGHALEPMADVDAIHVSVDLDVLDMTVAPATTAPTPGGLLSRELFQALRTIAKDERVVSFDLIGCAPPLESSGQRLLGANAGRTAMCGGRAVAHVVSGLQQR
jgi:formimidoylglutamase